MKNMISYYVKNVYGKETLYVKDPVIAQAITNVTGKLTIDDGDIKAFGVLGITFVEVLAPRG